MQWLPHSGHWGAMNDVADLTGVQNRQRAKATPRSLWSLLGPGLVTGAADDDPSGIGTYSQVGVQFGYSMGWTMIFGFPLLASIQAICAQIGAVTGRGLAQNLRRHYPPWLLRSVVVLLLVANIINLGADLGAMGAAFALLAPVPQFALTVAFGAMSMALEITMPYASYARVLKWATLSLLSYVAVLAVVDIPWPTVARGIFVPRLAFDRSHVMALMAILGTTISPYLFFWQAGQEVEEQHRRHVKPLHVSPRWFGRQELRRIRTDTLAGMAVSHLVALFIIVATAATIGASGRTEIHSAADAAEALGPIAGHWAAALFAAGIVGTGMLAVPILAGSAAYAVSECFGWVEGLDRKPREAKAFYATIAVATAGGVGLNAIGIEPMSALFWAAVINGVLAAPLMVVLMLIARNRSVMGRFRISASLAIGGWCAALTMAAATILLAIV